MDSKYNSEEVQDINHDLVHQVRSRQANKEVTVFGLEQRYPILKQSSAGQLGSEDNPIDVLYVNRIDGFTPMQGPPGKIPLDINVNSISSMNDEIFIDKTIIPKNKPSLGTNTNTFNSVFADRVVQKRSFIELSASYSGGYQSSSNRKLQVLGHIGDSFKVVESLDGYEVVNKTDYDMFCLICYQKMETSIEYVKPGDVILKLQEGITQLLQI